MVFLLKFQVPVVHCWYILYVDLASCSFATLMLTNAKSFLIDSLAFSTLPVMSSVNKDSFIFIFSVPHLFLFIFFPSRVLFLALKTDNIRFLFKPYFLFYISLLFVILISEFDKIQLVDWLEVFWGFFLFSGKC